ncbi:hypothetical protein [Sphingobacterium multivorum]|uniref:PD-(D/E)XK nuclease family transposase n=1 Tax=Sphingobacterium multivorum TaxID=28454 RepID=A0A2X2KS95_SPHMU|nr:hypothetical protein [Sphingobacterium multivorum]QRQ59650.1 hypothetical protein I6J33_15850 [Sphingobacterium multivorum]SPZ84959.1 Uncharacterised protein [Sphingobacterium multivorum]
MSYISSLEQKRVYNATIAYAEKEGMEKGRLEERAKAEAEKLAEKLKSALEFKKIVVAVEDIAKALRLTVEQVEELT